MIFKNIFCKLFNKNSLSDYPMYVENISHNTLENFILFVPSNSKFKVGDLIKHDLSYKISLRDNYCYLNYGIVVENYDCIDSNYVIAIGLDTNETKTIPIKMFNITKYAPHFKAWNVSQSIELHSTGLFKKTRDLINIYVNDSTIGY